MNNGARCDVSLGHGKFMIQSVSRTLRGIWIAMAPWEQLPATASDRELGAAIRAALEGSRTGVPHPEPGVSADDYGRTFLTAMGFRTLKEMTRGTRGVLVVEDSGRIRANVAGPEGLNTGEVVWSSNLEDEVIARAIRTALDKSAPIWE
jgi:hypothetical protein